MQRLNVVLPATFPAPVDRLRRIVVPIVAALTAAKSLVSREPALSQFVA